MFRSLYDRTAWDALVLVQSKVVLTFSSACYPSVESSSAFMMSGYFSVSSQNIDQYSISIQTNMTSERGFMFEFTAPMSFRIAHRNSAIFSNAGFEFIVHSKENRRFWHTVLMRLTRSLLCWGWAAFVMEKTCVDLKVWASGSLTNSTLIYQCVNGRCCMYNRCADIVVKHRTAPFWVLHVAVKQKRKK